MAKTGWFPKYGQTFHTHSKDNLRLFSKTCRETEHWKTIYKQRTSIERSNALDSIHYRYDCCDFSLNIIVRMLHLYGDSPLWSNGLKQDLKEDLKELLLGFDYWFDQNRSPFSGKQIMWTENHLLLFHACEYAAAALIRARCFMAAG